MNSSSPNASSSSSASALRGRAISMSRPPALIVSTVTSSTVITAECGASQQREGRTQTERGRPHDMAKKKSDDLFDALRARGVRKRVAKTISRLDPNPSTSKKARRRAESVLDDLRGAVGQVEDRLTGAAKRKAAAKKAAATRKRKAAARSRSAKKG